MHARKSARDAWFPTPEDHAFFANRGDVVFADSGAARRFAQRVDEGRGLVRGPEVAAMALLHEIFHAVIGIYRDRHPGSFQTLLSRLNDSLGEDLRKTVEGFVRALPPPDVYDQLVGRGSDENTPEAWLARRGPKALGELSEEVLLLWLTNQNPAYDPVRDIVGDRDLPPAYGTFVTESRSFFATEPPIGPRGQTLIELLLEPSRRAPNDIFAQVSLIEEEWGESLGLDRLPIWRRLAWARDLRSEEGRYFHRGGPGPGEPLLDPMQFQRGKDEEPKRFSQDLDWMPRVVLIAKTVFVWLDQLSKKYQRHIHRLDQIPNEELDRVASRGFTGLWLIGLFERSRASKKIKQMRGDQDAVASAYSLKAYDIAEELGGYPAYQNLRNRAWQRGIRLAADMVPNHVGVDGD
jgi:hypothetical protein